MDEFFNLILNSERETPLKSFFKEFNRGKNCSLFGLNLGEKSWLVNEIDKPIIFVTSNFLDSQKLKEQFESFGKRVNVLLFGQENYLINKTINKDNLLNLIDTLYHIAKNKTDILIVTPELLMQKLPTREDFLNHIISIKKGENVKIETLIQNLINIGFVRQDMVETVGDFSVRGDILDIFAPNFKEPIRVQFFDEVVESVEQFELNTYKSTKKLNTAEICPLTISFVNETWSQIINEINLSGAQLQKKLEPDNAILLKTNLEEVVLKLQNKSLNGIDGFVLPFLNYTTKITDYFLNSVVVFDDVKQVVDNVNFNYEQFYESIKSLLSGGSVLPQHNNFYFSKQEVFEIKNQKLSFQQITTANKIFNPDNVMTFKSSPILNYFKRYKLLAEDLKYYLEFKNTVIVYTKNLSTAKYLKDFLLENKINSNLIEENNEIKLKEINLIPDLICYGANFVENEIVIIGSTELLGKDESKVLQNKNKKDNFTLPKVNDYVVHETFGIGRCIAIQKLKFTDYEKDYIVIEYANGDKLFLPTEQVGLISAYNGTDKTPKLNRLGGKEFEKTKQRVKESLKELAFNLLKLYAERENQKGFKYEIDEPMLKEFENSFPFNETPDQITAINDIKNDMKSGKIMDRIVCGDVGYGKTEVALRSAFVAIMNGKQVAFLAPTTVLSEQHYNTCLSRLAPFSAQVQVLNRFKTPAEQKEIINKLKDGKIDVICGTHRLLSKDVQFKNLGLLILDEEQRFGVADKEKIKLLKTNVDVLTLSATPIPRTLHMGLVGIRDISLISTAPEGRLPIQTMVVEYSNSLVEQAINRELMRGGQVLIIYNEIETIFTFAEHIRSLLKPDVVLGVAHGQMPQKILEKQILDLYNGKTQVLISTTLIENGVDLPNANTLIVVNADRLGLSTLYQLRGRVGRSKNLGYAYFTYKANKMLSADAFKRLNAIMEFTALGSGFKIAMKDLEIRGCGNIMGKEQHGHMEKVGYDMYLKLLNEAVAEIRGEKNKQFKEVKIDIALNCFIPNNYIDDSENRFRIYNNLITINSLKSQTNVLKEIEDIYGKLPQEVANLSNVALIRNLSRQLDIKRVLINKNDMKVEFYSKESMFVKNITDALNKQTLRYVLTYTGLPIINFNFEQLAITEKVKKLIDFLLLAQDDNEK